MMARSYGKQTAPDYKISLSWIRAADKITVIGQVPEADELVHVTVIVAGAHK